MFLSLARRDERYVKLERRAIFRVPGKRVNENFILLTQSAAAVVSHTHARVPPKNVVFVFVSLRRRRISRTRALAPAGEKKKNQINDLFLGDDGGGARGTAKSRLLHFNVIPSAFAAARHRTLAHACV